MNKEIKKYTEMFHNTYEMLAPKYGYETRGDTKQLDFDSPNGKLMYATIKKIVYPILEENQQLKERLQEKEDIINKIIKKCNKEKGRTDFDIFINLNEQLKTLENFSKKIDYNLHPIITEAYKCAIRNSIENLCKTLRYDVVYKDSIKEILDNKGE